MVIVRNILVLVICFFQFTELSYSLEIDEKLTLRFLKVSGSKKTVLINRGAEDGLVVGDHAKFYITTGVVARGVAEKVSPSRSVWSLYRLVDPLQVVQDKVLNLKIATPVKITDDPSKSITEIPVEGGGSESINLSGDGSVASSPNEEKEMLELTGEGDTGAKESKESSEEISDAEMPATSSSKKKLPKVVAQSNSQIERSQLKSVSYRDITKSWEVWGSLAVNSLSGTFEGTAISGATDESFTSSSASSIEIAVGIEKYFFGNNSWINNLSLTGFVHKRTLKTGDDVKAQNSWLEYGGGANYHFYHSPADINTLIGFSSVTYGKGNVDLELNYISDSTGTGVTSSASGTNTFYSLGAGMKYVFANGLGLRSVIDYYKSSETFDNEGALTRNLSGIRVFLGGSYRF